MIRVLILLLFGCTPDYADMRLISVRSLWTLDEIITAYNTERNPASRRTHILAILMLRMAHIPRAI